MNTVRQNPRSVLKKLRLRVLVVKSTSLRIRRPAFLALGWSRIAINQMSGVLENGCQMVWAPESFKEQLEVYLEVWCMTRFISRHQHRTGKSKKLKFPGQLEQEWDNSLMR